MTLKLFKYIYKKFSVNIISKGGRNRMGRITVNHRGSKCALKKRYLNLDLKYSVTNINYVLLKTLKVKCRTGHVGLILYKNGLFSYILVPKLVKVGTIWSFEYLRILKIGDYLKLLLIPEGYSIYNIEIKLGYGGQIARSAGTSVKIINRYPNKYNKILLKFRSGEEYFVNVNCGATIGVSSNSDNWLVNLRKAGVRRLFGFRPKVRGIAMNPVDHAHGGNTNGGKPCMTPKGLLTKGVKTRKRPVAKNIIFKRRERRIDCLIKVKNYKLK